jgi:hypothetical protein
MGAAWRETIGRKSNFNQILEYVKEIRYSLESFVYPIEVLYMAHVLHNHVQVFGFSPRSMFCCHTFVHLLCTPSVFLTFVSVYLYYLASNKENGGSIFFFLKQTNFD